MEHVELMPQEGILEHMDEVRFSAPGLERTQAGELLLTNLNIVFVHRQPRLFGKARVNTFRYPLSEIKVVRGRPQVLMDKGEEHSCEIRLVRGVLKIDFGSHKELSIFVNALHKELTGKNEDVVGPPDTVIGAIASSISNVTKEFTQAFTMNNLKSKASQSQSLSLPCKGCGAILTGEKGSRVTCEYCGGTTTLR